MADVTQLPDPVRLSRLEREIATRMLEAKASKLIAGELEKSVGTINRRIADMCRRAMVRDRFEFLLWLLQNQRCLTRGALTQPGLHPDSCRCSQFCMGRLILKQA